jgi:hypothetical protein
VGGRKPFHRGPYAHASLENAHIERFFLLQILKHLDETKHVLVTATIELTPPNSASAIISAGV